MSFLLGAFSSNTPKLGIIFPESSFKAVDLPIPLIPNKPKIDPGCGDGKPCNLKQFLP